VLQRPSANASAVFDSGARRVEQRPYERLEDIEDRFWWSSHHGSFPDLQLKGTNVVDVYIGRLFRRLKGIVATGVILGKTTRRCGPSKHFTLRQAMAAVCHQCQMLTTELDY
jgi:hypothetical protein